MGSLEIKPKIDAAKGRSGNRTKKGETEMAKQIMTIDGNEAAAHVSSTQIGRASCRERV